MGLGHGGVFSRPVVRPGSFAASDRLPGGQSNNVWIDLDGERAVSIGPDTIEVDRTSIDFDQATKTLETFQQMPRRRSAD